MMSSKGWAYLSLCCVHLPGLAAQTCPNQDSLKPGIVIENIAKNSEAEKAGLQAGDILLRWVRGEIQGEIGSPFDLATVEIEQAPKRSVALEGLRGSERRVWRLGEDTSGIQVRPNFSSATMTSYRDVEELAAAGRLAEATERWCIPGGEKGSSNPAWLRVWLLVRLAEIEAEGKHWKESDETYQLTLQAAAAAPHVIPLIERSWGITFMQRNEWEHAGEHFRQALTLEEAKGTKTLDLAVSSVDLGNVAEKQGDLANADHYYHQALRLQEDLAPESLALAVSLNHIGGLAQARGELDSAEGADQRALAIAEKVAPRSLTVAEALGNLGDVAFDRGKLTPAKDYYGRSLEICHQLTPGSLGVAKALNRMGRVAWKTGDLAKADEYYQAALAIRQKLAPGSLDVASSLNGLGLVAWQRGDLPKADTYHHQALAIKEKLSPGSLDVANSLNNLGLVAWQRGDLAQAHDYHHQALEIRESFSPGSLAVATSLNNLGLVAWQRGDLAQAHDYYHQALAIKEKLSPGSLDVASSLNNLGLVAWQRGDLAQADEYHHQALTIREKLAPGSMNVAESLNNLGAIAYERRDLSKAEDYFHQAVAIREKLAPGSLLVARNLSNLGDIAREQGDLNKAEEYERQALVIIQKLVPGSLDVASSLNNLGLVAYQRGDFDKAEAALRQALTIRDQLAPGSVDFALNLNHLALLLETRGEPDEAAQCYRRALAIWEKQAPGSASLADALAGLASIQRRRGELDTAAQSYERALDALENQTTRLGGSGDVRAGFRAKRRKYYHDFASLLIQQGKMDAAFEVLERSRVRTLVEMLASSHLDIRRGADPALLERERSLRADLVAKSNRRIRMIGAKNSDEQIKTVENEIIDLNNEYQDVEGRIRSTSPAYAALTQPHPMSAGAVQHLLSNDSLLLEYSLGEDRSYLFAITTSSLHSYELPKSSVIEPIAKRLYQSLIERGRIPKQEGSQSLLRLAKADAAYRNAAAELSQIVLAPVASELKKRRLLIVSDGALQYVPFAALPISASLSRKRPEPLIVEHEIVNLPSASVFALLRDQRGEFDGGAPRKEAAVFADPVFDGHDPRVRLNPTQLPSKERGSEPAEDLSKPRAHFTDSLARSISDANLAQRGQLPLLRLSFSRDEADAILRVVPQGSSMEASGFNATRSLAISGQLAHYRIVHFATHALVDNVHPELSGLVLSLVDSQGTPVDGFLDLEDIYNLDLSADLVVLSACETALGKEINGDGMIGLTRGFMYAGAPSVIATLWNVNDFASAKLMAFFYQAMEREGMKPAAALRRAQLAMWRQHSSSAPYYWAGFVVQGDWE